MLTELIAFQSVGLYALIGFWIYAHNRMMGHWLPGVIVSVFWPAVPIIWCFAWVAEYMHETHLKRIIKECEENE